MTDTYTWNSKPCLYYVGHSKCRLPGTYLLLGRYFCHQHVRMVADQLLATVDGSAESMHRLADDAFRRGVLEGRAQGWRLAVEAGAAKPVRPARRTYVYYAKRGRYVKIGKAVDIQARLRSLSHGGVIMPDDIDLGPLELIGSHPEKVMTEKQVHIALRNLRVVGEWFMYGDAITEHIAKVGKRCVA